MGCVSSVTGAAVGYRRVANSADSCRIRSAKAAGPQADQSRRGCGASPPFLTTSSRDRVAAGTQDRAPGNRHEVMTLRSPLLARILLALVLLVAAVGAGPAHGQ